MDDTTVGDDLENQQLNWVELPSERSTLGESHGDDEAGTSRNDFGEPRICPICCTEVGADDACTSCPDCGMVYHTDCWKENLGCATYGCRSAGCLEPPPEKIEVEPQPFQSDKTFAFCPACGARLTPGEPWCWSCGGNVSPHEPIPRRSTFPVKVVTSLLVVVGIVATIVIKTLGGIPGALLRVGVGILLGTLLYFAVKQPCGRRAWLIKAIAIIYSVVALYPLSGRSIVDYVPMIIGAVAGLFFAHKTHFCKKCLTPAREQFVSPALEPVVDVEPFVRCLAEHDIEPFLQMKATAGNRSHTVLKIATCRCAQLNLLTMKTIVQTQGNWINNTPSCTLLNSIAISREDASAIKTFPWLNGGELK